MSRTEASSPVNLPRAGRREWIGLDVLALGTMLYSMDLTVLHLAVRALSEDLQPSSAQLLWILDIYGFSQTSKRSGVGHVGRRLSPACRAAPTATRSLLDPDLRAALSSG